MTRLEAYDLIDKLFPGDPSIVKVTIGVDGVDVERIVRDENGKPRWNEDRSAPLHAVEHYDFEPMFAPTP